MIFEMDVSTWDFLTKTPGLVFVLFLFRYCTIKFLWRPLGNTFNISPYKSKRPSPNPSLEILYQNEGLKALKNGKDVIMAKQCGLSSDEVKNWFLLRDKWEEEPDLDRFCYDCWMATYYFFSNLYGLLTLTKKNWVWDVEACWHDISSHNLDSEATYYLTVCFAFFILDSSVLFLKNYERRDYYLIRVHHIASGSCIAFGYHCNMIQFSCLTHLLLELVTPFPYVSRIARKVQCTWVADLSLFCLTSLWAIARVFLLHFWLLPSYVNFRKRSDNYSLGAVTFDVLLFVICTTNILWSRKISNKFVKAYLKPIRGQYSNPWKTVSLRVAERG